MKQITVKPGQYDLKRVSDGEGDIGPILRTVKWAKKQMYANETEIESEYSKIKVGRGVFVGSTSHWWITTPVKEILEVSEDKRYVKFITENNSIYELNIR